MLGLPEGVGACLFDLDGVLTRTAELHATAWERMFDDFLRRWAQRTGEPFRAFELPREYDEYVDGKPRLDGVRSFLAARAFDLPLGSPDDPPHADTVHGLGRRKNELVLELIRLEGVRTYDVVVRDLAELLELKAAG